MQHYTSSAESAFDMTEDQPLRTLRGLVAQEQSAGFQWYWLLDQSALPQHGWLRRHVGRAQWVDVLGGNSETTFNGATPVLVSAASATAGAATTSSFVGELYRVGRFANAISLLESPLSISDLQTALCERSRIDLPGQLEAVLRYFDTRTLPLLPQLFTPLQYAEFTRSIQRWAYLDRWGAVQRLPIETQPSGERLPAPARLKLDDPQEAMLIDDGLTDAVIDLMLTQRHTSLLDRSPPEQFDTIDPLVSAARAADLAEPFEVLAYASKALAEGADFSQREPWLSRLKQYRERTCSLEEAFL
jgi:hypothetical protein